MTPLAGLRVLDLSKVIAGPLCAQYLSDFGAEIVKVESCDVGDDTRSWAPLSDGTGTAFLALNRNKQSLAIDLKSEAGRRIVHQLAQRADVVIESFAPATKTRLGIDYDTLRQGRSDLVYCSISGFGQTGPLRDLLGFDAILQAFTGLMAMNGESGGGPTRLPVSPIDQMTGLNAALGIQAALMNRQQTGRGAYLEVSLFETATAMLAINMQGFWKTGEVPQRLGSAHPSICPYQVFRASDDYVLVGIANDRLWRRFCKAVEREDLAEDPRYRRNPDRVARFDETVALTQAIIGTRPRDAWIALLNGLDVPCAPVNTIADLDAHPHLAARGLVVGHPDDRAKTIAMPIVFDGQIREAGSAPPSLGEHTGCILRSIVTATTRSRPCGPRALSAARGRTRPIDRSCNSGRSVGASSKKPKVDDDNRGSTKCEADSTGPIWRLCSASPASRQVTLLRRCRAVRSRSGY